MSTIVKKELVQSHDRYVKLTRDIMWLNLTLFKMTPSRCTSLSTTISACHIVREITF